MTTYTQTELLENDFQIANKGVLDDLLINGLYILGATSKIGKSMIATKLANVVGEGSEYLGRHNEKSRVIYFDNDNYEHETKARLLALELSSNENVSFVFGEKSSSLASIKEYINHLSNIEQYTLIVIDCLINLLELSDCDGTYNSIYPILINFRDFIIEKELVCIILHHTKKGFSVGQDSLLGSKALSGSTTGTIVVDVENEFSTTGKLQFILRHKKTIIPISKDKNGIGWDLGEENDIEETIPRNILLLINKVVSSPNHMIKGTCQEIVQQTMMEINPNGLMKYLKKHQDYLNQNHIFFEQTKGNQRIDTIKYLPE